MKESSAYGARLKRLCNRLKREIGPLKETEKRDPLTEMLLACLNEVVSASKAKTALNRLRSQFVDYNELRVARPEEVIEALGKGFPKSREFMAHLTALLQDVFVRQDTLELDELENMGKREAKAFLQELDHAGDYVVARVMLNCLDGHAFPVNREMLTMLRGEGVVDPKADLAEVQGFLERHISATQIKAVYTLLQHHAEHYKPPAAAGKKTVSKKTATRKAASVAAKKKTKKASKKKVKKTSKAPTKKATHTAQKAAGKNTKKAPKKS